MQETVFASDIATERAAAHSQVCRHSCLKMQPVAYQAMHDQPFYYSVTVQSYSRFFGLVAVCIVRCCMELILMITAECVP